MAKAQRRPPQDRSRYQVRKAQDLLRLALEKRAELELELERCAAMEARAVWQLRNENGWSWSRIAAPFGISAQAAHKRWATDV